MFRVLRLSIVGVAFSLIAVGATLRWQPIVSAQTQRCAISSSSLSFPIVNTERNNTVGICRTYTVVNNTTGDLYCTWEPRRVQGTRPLGGGQRGDRFRPSHRETGMMFCDNENAWLGDFLQACTSYQEYQRGCSGIHDRLSPR